MTGTNTFFAAQVAKARTREERLQQEQAAKIAFEKEKAAAIRRQKDRAALRDKIRTKIARFTQGFVAAVAHEFTKNPHKPWGAERIETADEYVTYLTTNFVSGQVPTAPEIAPHDAGVIRDKFAWGLVVANANDTVKVPDGALVGQHEDWFPELLEKKRAEYARFVQRRQAAKAQTDGKNNEPPTEDQQDEGAEEAQTSAEPLTEERIRELAESLNRRRAHRSAQVIELKPAITRKKGSRRSRAS